MSFDRSHSRCRPLDRPATLALVESLDEESVARAGTANNAAVSVRALCSIIPGHTQHHLDVLRERYGVRW